MALTLAPKLSPFPFAALAAAAFTQKAEIAYDDTATAPVLELDGSKITGEEEIVHALTKDLGIAEGSNQVSEVSKKKK